MKIKIFSILAIIFLCSCKTQKITKSQNQQLIKEQKQDFKTEQIQELEKYN